MPDATIQLTGLQADITNSLASVWKQYAGKRPVSADTEIKGNVIRCLLEGVREFDEGMTASESDAGENGKRLTSGTYRTDAVVAVAKASRGRVMAFVSKHDAETDIATETFILDRPPRRRPAVAAEVRPDFRG